MPGAVAVALSEAVGAGAVDDDEGVAGGSVAGEPSSNFVQPRTMANDTANTRAVVLLTPLL